MIEPCTPLTERELESLARIRDRAPDYASRLDDCLPSRRFYVALGSCTAVALNQAPVVVLRLKDEAGLAEWHSRVWTLFARPPRLEETTLAALLLIEQIVGSPPAKRHLLDYKAYLNATGIRFATHLYNKPPQSGNAITLWNSGYGQLRNELRMMA